MTNNANILLHLSLIDGVGPVAIERIINTVVPTVGWDNLYLLPSSDWQHRAGFSALLSQKIVAGLADQKALDDELLLSQRNNVAIVSLLSDDYPLLLRSISAPPAILYVRGVLPVHDRTIALVGSRKAGEYAQVVIQELVPALVASEWTIVSGGALGADSMAHVQTVKNGGVTVAVLGSGLLVPYPRSNIRLFDEIVSSGGALVSIFSLKTSALAGNFPARNRIIAGMSRGCVVIQAAEKSGAAITAEYALQQGKEVFAVPGLINDPLSAGCHRLIQEGAKLVTNTADILVEFGYKIMPAVTVHQKKVEVTTHACTPQEKILQACRAQAHTLEELMTLTNESMATLQSLLFDLQCAGSLEQDFAGRFTAV